MKKHFYIIPLVFICILTTVGCSKTSDSPGTANQEYHYKKSSLKDIFSKLHIEKGESTQQMIERLGYREVTTGDGFDFTIIRPNLIAKPNELYSYGKVGAILIELPNGRIENIALEDSTYTDGRIVTKDIGTLILRSNYAEYVSDVSWSILMSDEQIAAVQERYKISTKTE